MANEYANRVHAGLSRIWENQGEMQASIDDLRTRLKAVRDLCESAGMHIECSIYESRDVQDFLKMVIAETQKGGDVQ